jgi:poly-gamma-glutamate synthesis protein (capsule biosynthesis protein)
MASLHWGGNWGYEIPPPHRRFAHALIDRAGIDLVHGHSSHHPKAVEVHRGRLILYGCGDLINDYEGISGYDEFRGDLRLLHRVSVDPSGALVAAELLPFQSHRLRLRRTEPLDTGWLATLLDESSRDFGVRARRTPAGVIELSWT